MGQSARRAKDFALREGERLWVVVVLFLGAVVFLYVPLVYGVVYHDATDGME